MSTHVPAIGLQSHRMRDKADRNLEHHHHRGDADHDAGASFCAGKIRNEIVRMPKRRMIRTMHGEEIKRFVASVNFATAHLRCLSWANLVTSAEITNKAASPPKRN